MVTTGINEAAAQSAEEVFGESIRFSKYTSFGNTFIVVDESENPHEDDASRAEFARWVLNGDFGIGGTDNVLYIRAAGESERSADGEQADFVFRIFEYDGSETLSCGNGLLSTAAYLHRVTAGREWDVLTELPSGKPKLIRIGTNEQSRGTWMVAGWPRPAPADLYRRSGPEPESAVDTVVSMTVPLPRNEDWSVGLPESVLLSGLLSYTGEPHMVLFEGTGFPRQLGERLWLAQRGERSSWIGVPDTPEMAASSSLVHHIGMYVNEHFRDVFPQGVHLNFARVLEQDTIEYRTWERAINCETLACGSGTVAIAHIGRLNGLISGSEFTFLPHRCRWYQRDASLEVHLADDGYRVSGRPQAVCDGVAPKAPLRRPRTPESTKHDRPHVEEV